MQLRRAKSRPKNANVAEQLVGQGGTTQWVGQPEMCVRARLSRRAVVMMMRREEMVYEESE